MAESQIPQTNEDLQVLMEAVEAELALPQEEQDSAFLNEAIPLLEAAVPGTGGQFQQQLPQQPQAVQPRQEMVPGQGFPVQVTPQQQIGQEAFMLEAQFRMQDVADFFRRPFMDDAEQTDLATRRRVERAKARLDLDAKAVASGVDPSELQPARISGELAPDVATAAIPGMIARRTAGGIAGRVTAEAGVGAVLGGASVPLDQDPQGQAALEAGVATGFGILGEIPGIAQDFVLREFQAARRGERFEALSEVETASGVPLTLAEKTDSPAVIQAERGLAGRPGGVKEQFFEERAQRLEASFAQVQDRLNPASLTTGEIVRQTRQSFDQTVNEMTEAASTAFRDELTDVADDIGARIDKEGRIVGGFQILQPRRTLAEMEAQFNALRDRPITGASRRELASLQEKIVGLQRNIQKGGMTLGQIQEVERDLSKITRLSGNTLRDVNRPDSVLDAGRIKRALSEDINEAVADPATPIEFEEALRELEAARARFGQRLQQVDGFKATALERLLGKAGADPSSRTFGDRIISMDTKEFTDLMGMVDNTTPGLANNIRAAVFESLLERVRFLDPSRSTASRQVPSIDAPQLAGILNAMDFSKFKSFLAPDLPDQQVRHLQNTMTAIAAIARGPNVIESGVGRPIQSRIEQFAINAVSQDQGFIARLVAGELTPGMMERLLFTRAGLDSLSTIGKPRVGRAEFAQAMNHVLNVMREDDEQRQARLVEEQRRAGLSRAAQPPL